MWPFQSGQAIVGPKSLRVQGKLRLIGLCQHNRLTTEWTAYVLLPVQLNHRYLLIPIAGPIRRSPLGSFQRGYVVPCDGRVGGEDDFPHKVLAGYGGMVTIEFACNRHEEADQWPWVQIDDEGQDSDQCVFPCQLREKILHSLQHVLPGLLVRDCFL